MPSYSKCIFTVNPNYLFKIATCFLTLIFDKLSVATRLRCGGIFSYHFTANLSLSLTVKDFWKSVKIWQSYRHEFDGPVFWNTV